MSSFLLSYGEIMQQFVDVCVNLTAKQLNKTFTYRLPEAFAGVEAGWRVVVPFAGQLVEAFVIQKYASAEDYEHLKEVAELLEEQAWFDEKMLALADWLAGHYLCTLAQALRLFLPGKKSLAKKMVYKLNEEVEYVAANDYERNLLTLFAREQFLPKEKIKSRLGHFDEEAMEKLVGKNVLSIHKQLKSKFKKQLVTFVKLNCDVEAYLSENPKTGAARKNALLLLQQHDGELSTGWLSQNGISLDTLKRMQKHGLVCFEQRHVVRDSYIDIVANDNRIVLNEEQAFAVQNINECFHGKQAKTFLLYGITGSGKTQVYLETTKNAYQAGKQVLVLVPEIALTGQTISRFKDYFDQDVLVFHSRLSLNERMDVFEQVKTGEPCILIGVRSAVFAPFANLGLIIMDEEHEYSYKQEEKPGYHARDVAQKLAALNNVPLVLGSATPSIESYYKANTGEYSLLRLSQRPINALLPDVVAVDMKEELQQGHFGVISRRLQYELEQVREKNEQAVILLNRRGYATFVMCRDCGHTEKCEHCAVSLVYHQNDVLLRCHYCGYAKKTPDECPNCKSRRIKFFGSGTQKAEEQLGQQMPELKIVRMDQDTTGTKMGHDKILNAFKKGEYDLLLGTQMVAKGHDVHNVTLVGVLAADAILNLPDFRAAERTFALLTQAAGRAGRGEKKGLVVLQAYEAEHPVLSYVQSHDYEAFYQYEIREREELFYPPYCSLLKITTTGKSKEESVKKALQIVEKLKQNSENKDIKMYVNGPFTGMVEKIKDVYKSIIIIKADSIEFVKTILQEEGYVLHKDVIIDINPLNVV